MATPVTTGKLHDGMEMGAVHSEEMRPGASMYHGYPVEFASMLTNQTTAVDQPQMTAASYVASDLTSPQQGHVLSSAVKQPLVSPMKRPAPPDLHSLQEAKQPRLSHDQATTRESTIKLSDHTPTINIDLSNFSDIFDIPSGLGDEGLAGRPKTPVYQSLSPAVPKSQSDAAASGSPCTVSEVGVLKNDHRSSPVVSEDIQHKPVVVDCGSSVGSPATSVSSHASSAPPQPQSPPHPPVLTTLSNHTHTGAPVTAGPSEDGGFLEQLVSMYLPKEEKPISTLKNEFQVYTDSQNRTFTYRYDDPSHHGPSHGPHPGSLEHMLTAAQRVPTHSTHHEETFYDRNHIYRNATAPGPVTESLISPLLSAGHFDYTTSITDYYNSQQAAAVAAAAAAATTSTAGVVSSSDSPLSAFTPSYQTSVTPSTSTMFGHMTSKYLL